MLGMVASQMQTPVSWVLGVGCGTSVGTTLGELHCIASVCIALQCYIGGIHLLGVLHCITGFKPGWAGKTNRQWAHTLHLHCHSVCVSSSHYTLTHCTHCTLHTHCTCIATLCVCVKLTLHNGHTHCTCTASVCVKLKQYCCNAVQSVQSIAMKYSARQIWPKHTLNRTCNSDSSSAFKCSPVAFTPFHYRTLSVGLEQWSSVHLGAMPGKGSKCSWND